MTAIGCPESVIKAPDDPVYRRVLAMRNRRALEAKILAAWQRWGGHVPYRFRIRILQTHYKPFIRARIVAEATVEWTAGQIQPLRQLLFLQTFPCAERPRGRFAKARRQPLLSCAGPPVFLLDEWDTVVWALPNEPKLRTLNVCLDSAVFRRFLGAQELGPSESTAPQGPRLVRYVPRKRALFRYQTSSQAGRYMKIYLRGQDETAATNLQAVSTAIPLGEGVFRSPSLVTHTPAHSAVVMTELPGQPLTTQIHKAPASTFTNVGRALAELHTSSVPTAISWSPAHELTALARAMTDVKRALPVLGFDIDDLVDDLQRRWLDVRFNKAAPIHGNLFCDQEIAVVMTELPGQPLTTQIHKAPASTFTNVGRALAELHTSSVPTAISWSPAHELTALARAMTDVKRALPVLGFDIDDLVDDLQRRWLDVRFNEAAPIHGNLFCDQILVHPDHIGIVDWDDLCQGDPLYDVARLIAHILYLSLEGQVDRGRAVAIVDLLLQGYGQRSQRRILWSRLRLHVVMALLLRAKISALRALPAGWMADVASVVKEARGVLNGRCCWSTQ